MDEINDLADALGYRFRYEDGCYLLEDKHSGIIYTFAEPEETMEHLQEEDEREFGEHKWIQ